MIDAVHAARHHASQASEHMRYHLNGFRRSIAAGSSQAAGSMVHAASDLRRAVGSSMAEAAAGFAEAAGRTKNTAGRAGRAFGHAVTTPVHLARIHFSSPKVCPAKSASTAS